MQHSLVEEGFKGSVNLE